MWIFLRDSFLSVVQHDEDRRFLQVRARIRGDIEKIFPEAVVAEDDRGDYRFCCTLSRERVAHTLALKLQHIDYSSINDVVDDTERAIPYDRVYSAMLDEQMTRYGGELDPLPLYVPSYDLDAEETPEAALLEPGLS